MRNDDIQRLMLERAKLRVEPNMAAYVNARLEQAPPAQNIIVMGGDARTGVPRREAIDPRTLK